MNVLEKVKEQYQYMVACRRYFHENPETSGNEIETMKFIQKELDIMRIHWIHIENGGILAFINRGRPGKTILLRADMDALPIKENPQNRVSAKLCISKKDGISHACGHDAHMSMLLAQARILNEDRDNIDGSIILCFEQSEESPIMADNLMRYLENTGDIHVDTVYATHMRWNLPVGKMSVTPGAALSGVIGFNGTIRGAAGHGSRPDLANSPIDCFTSVYQGLHELKMRKCDPFKPLTFSLGTLNSGKSINVIPEELTFSGTIRFFDIKSGDIFWQGFKELMETQARSFNCKAELIMSVRMLPVLSNEDCSKICAAGIKKYVGDDVLQVMEPWMASESVGIYLTHYPGVCTFTGIQNTEMGTGANHHTPEFDLDESAMITGAATAIGYVYEFLDNKEPITFEREFEDVEDLIRCYTDL